MALIKCPECGRDISDKAECCPGCGCPASEWKKDIESKENIEPEENSIVGKNGYIIEKKNGKFIAYENGAIKIECSEKMVRITEILFEKGEKIYGIWTPKKDSFIKFIPENEEENRRMMKVFFDEIQIYLVNNKKDARKCQRKEPDYPYTICSSCGEYNKAGVFVCKKCKHEYSPKEIVIIYPQNKNNEIKQEKKEFKGIYRYGIFGGRTEVRCPRCGSEDCSHYQEQKIIPGKTKTRYTANLNPLKPFTLVNKKEKVIKKEQIISEDKIVCNKCGKVF